MNKAVISVGRLDSLSKMLVEEEQFNGVGGTTGRRLFILINSVILTGVGSLFKLAEVFLMGVSIRLGFFSAPVTVVGVDICVILLFLAEAFILTMIGFVAEAFAGVISSVVAFGPSVVSVICVVSFRNNFSLTLNSALL